MAPPSDAFDRLGLAQETSGSDPTIHGHAEFAAFYRETAPRLVAFLHWQGAPLPDAADCAQEALIQAYRQWTNLRHPHAWCRVVASRLYARRLAAQYEDPVDDLDRAASSPLIAAGSDIEEHHALLALLDHLPTRQRQVMAWTYDGATSIEIAAALKISPAAVRSSLTKARGRLRQLLVDAGGPGT